MNVSRISVIAAAAFILFCCSGCQDDQLKQCQQENTDLQAKIEAQASKIQNLENQSEGVTVVLGEMAKEMDRLKNENNRLKASKPAQEAAVDSAVDAEEAKKADVQKGLQELFKLRQEAAEKLKKQQP